MGTTTEKLTYLQGTKDAIKNAIEAKGVEVPEGTTFRGYAEKIQEIKQETIPEKVFICTCNPKSPAGKSNYKIATPGEQVEIKLGYETMPSDFIAIDSFGREFTEYTYTGGGFQDFIITLTAPNFSVLFYKN